MRTTNINALEMDRQVF